MRSLLPTALLAVTAACSPAGPAAPASVATQSAQLLPLAPPTNLSYGGGTHVLTAGRAAAPLVPTVTGIVRLYSVFPPLPPGLELDVQTGVLHGTPQVPSRPNDFLVTAANQSGSTTAAVRLQVLPFHVQIEPHQDGQAAEVRLLAARWGRLADVWAEDPSSGARQRVTVDLVVGEDIQSDGVDFRLEADRLPGDVRVVVLHALGTPAFASAYDRLQLNLVPLLDRDLQDLPPFTMVPRDAAIELVFDDLLDPATITADTLRVLTGYPPAAAAPARAFADPNHGALADPDGDGHRTLQPTRAILDLAVGEYDGYAHPGALGNELGLPGATGPSLPNVLLRLPTAAGLPGGRVQNLAGNPVSFAQSGSNDPLSPSLDVVRALRSGGDSAATGDVFNGYLADLEPPRVAVRQEAQVAAVTPHPGAGPGHFLVDLDYAADACAAIARAGDAVRQVGGVAGRLAEIVEAPPAPVGGLLAGVHVEVLAGGSLAAGPCQVETAFDPVLDAARAACFVRFSQASAPPAAGVSPTTSVRGGFGEAMDPRTVAAFEALAVARVASPTDGRDLVVGTVAPLSDGRTFELVPSTPLAHQGGAAETYHARLGLGLAPARDPAGNVLAAPLPVVPFALEAGAPTAVTGGVALRFAALDEVGNDGLREVRGQLLHDLAAGLLQPRAVVHSDAIVDRTRPVPSFMPPLVSGVQVPLSPLGARMQQVWRYCDAGLGLLDETWTNVDVEGLAWSPSVPGGVIADQYGAFEIRLAHAAFLPDELPHATLLPAFPNSGLGATFASNALDGLHVVHPRARGYTLNPADQFVASTGTAMMPYPLNRGIPAAQFVYYTWRDTALTGLAAPGGTGAELAIVTSVLGSGTPGAPFPAGQVPTIGLPLLLEFRCFPDAGAVGLNAFAANIAIASSARPGFRAFSAGGVNSGGQVVLVDPDASATATGGFDPSSVPPGQPTLGIDNTFYLGQVDLVTRLSRVHTVWFDTGLAAPIFAPPVVLPIAGGAPAGTQIVTAWRGATSVTGAIAADATTLDAYGAPPTPAAGAVIFFNGDASWKPAPVDGARWAQARITFVGDPVSNATAPLDALGLAWQ